MITNSEWIAWAAGFFEGEGCFGQNRSPLTTKGVQNYFMSMTITQQGDNGLKLMKRFRRIVGCGSIYHFKKSDMWGWTTFNIIDIRRIYKLFKPYLSPRRLARYKELSEQQKLNRFLSPCRLGKK